MTYEQFIEKISKYININDYDIRFKKSKYYENENEMWLYRKKDKGNPKKIITGYEMNDIFYKNRKLKN